VEILIFSGSCCGFAALRLISLTLDFVCFNTLLPWADVWHHNTFPMSSSSDSSVTAFIPRQFARSPCCHFMFKKLSLIKYVYLSKTCYHFLNFLSSVVDRQLKGAPRSTYVGCPQIFTNAGNSARGERTCKASILEWTQSPRQVVTKTSVFFFLHVYTLSRVLVTIDGVWIGE
jgi:hypothetical protein